jgi:diacylglycerol kinase
MKSFQYALQGLLTAIRSEVNLRFHIVAAVLVCAAGIWLQLQRNEWIAVVFAITLVIVLELFNTAIEQLCNAVTTEHNLFIKKAKDISAAAVLMASAGSAIVGCIIFLPKIISLINS